MIKINKDFARVPASLNSPQTNNCRNEIIESRRFLKGRRYSVRYRQPDVKERLTKLYHNKCAFCEQRIERFDIEHFRPKSIYYWLAYSWDNLLLACPVCNNAKTNFFETLENKAEFSDEDLQNIHHLSERYNQEEKNLFVHPEFQDAEPLLIFKKNGEILSKNDHVKYTIEKCKINRDYLNDRRAKILYDLKDKIIRRFYLYKKNKKRDDLIKIKALIENFIEDAYNNDNEFLAFRRYAVKNFLNELKEIIEK